MSTSIAADTTLRSSVPETPHAVAPPPPAAEADAKVVPSVSEPPRFTSPVVKVDSGTGLALLVVRDGDTGREVEQYPSRQVVEEYRRHIPTSVGQQQEAAAAAASQSVAQSSQSAPVDVKAPPAPVVSAPAPLPSAPAAPVSSGSGGKSVSI